ncbi:ABC transporter G family member 11 [Platanthera guangdongensis]|uniref:ABC transporter G family member 11 n=1 Tax=Platanthera guangdongensis TaxID=2320717 RepID=A0ABR2LWS2_9ASPA
MGERAEAWLPDWDGQETAQIGRPEGGADRGPSDLGGNTVAWIGRPRGHSIRAARGMGGQGAAPPERRGRSLSETLWREKTNTELLGDVSARLTWKDLTVTVALGSGETQQVLEGLTGYAEPGSFTALMGPSGSGSDIFRPGRQKGWSALRGQPKSPVGLLPTGQREAVDCRRPGEPSVAQTVGGLWGRPTPWGSAPPGRPIGKERGGCAQGVDTFLASLSIGSQGRERRPSPLGLGLTGSHWGAETKKGQSAPLGRRFPGRPRHRQPGKERAAGPFGATPPPFGWLALGGRGSRGGQPLGGWYHPTGHPGGAQREVGVIGRQPAARTSTCEIPNRSWRSRVWEFGSRKRE